MTDLAELRAFAGSALVSDALDALGSRAHCLGFDVQPLGPGTLLVGRAYTVSCERADGFPEVPYVGLLQALDGLGPDDVYTLASGRATDSAFWGELLTNAAKAAGAAGALTDGPVRDVRRIRELGFPVFCRGTVPYDINSRFEVTGVGEPLELDGVRVAHGDLIVADDDGVAIVPAALEQEVVARVRAKAEGESRFREAVRAGMKPSAAFREFGVL